MSITSLRNWELYKKPLFLYESTTPLVYQKVEMPLFQKKNKNLYPSFRFLFVSNDSHPWQTDSFILQIKRIPFKQESINEALTGEARKTGKLNIKRFYNCSYFTWGYETNQGILIAVFEN